MREADKGWKRSTKLHVALASGAIMLGLYIDNRHNIVLADHFMSCAELALVAALGGRVGMSITQEIMGSASQFNYTPDPKDVDDGQIS